MNTQVRETLKEELKFINEQLEKSFPGDDPELILYPIDGSWVINFDNGNETVGETIEELYNFIDNCSE